MRICTGLYGHISGSVPTADIVSSSRRTVFKPKKAITAELPSRRLSLFKYNR